MTRVITIAGTAITSTSELDSIKVGGQAKQGDSALSEIILYDDSNTLFGASEAFIRKQWSVTENASGTAVYLGRGRIAAFETHRGDEDSVQAVKVQYTFALEDQNLELRGHDVNGWERPAETGYARVQALGTAYLNGSPRSSTNLNTTTYVPSTNGVTMPAKTYNGSDAIDVITECAAAEDKKFFVTVDHELWYDLETSTSYLAGLEISDGVGAAGDPDGTNYFGPIWDMGSALSWEGQEYASRIRLTYNSDFSVLATDATSESAHDLWVKQVADTESTTAAMASAFASAELVYRKGGGRTYALSLKIPAAQVYKLKVGQLVWIQAQAAVDTTARVQRRIAELMWEPAGPYWYIARLNLDRPVRRRPRGSIRGQTPTGPKPPPICLPDTVVSPTTIWHWTFTTDNEDDESSTYNHAWERVVSGGFGDYPPANAAFGSHYGRNNGGAYASDQVPISASTDYSFRCDILWRYDPTVRYVDLKWYSSAPALLRTDRWIDGAGHATDTMYHKTATYSAPVGAASVQFRTSNFAGMYGDNFYIETPGSIIAADNDPDCVEDGGDSPYFVRSDDPRFDQLATLVATDAPNWKRPVRVATTIAGTLASSFEDGDTVDGVVLEAGDRILLKDQAAGATNGIYTVNATGAPTRATDFDLDEDVPAATAFVSEGTTNGNKVFVCTTNDPIQLDTTTLVFAEISADPAIDHGGLTGLADNDHPQYRLTTGGGEDVINVVAASGASETLSATANDHQITLTSATVAITLPTLTAGVYCSISVLLIQDGIGNRTADWSANDIDWIGGSEPVLETAPGAFNRINFETRNGSTTWIGDAGESVAALDDLTDVTITSPASGAFLRYNGSAWIDALLVATDYLFHDESLTDGASNFIFAGGDIVTVVGVPN